MGQARLARHPGCGHARDEPDSTKWPDRGPSVTGGDHQDPRKYVRLAGLLRREIEDGTLAARQRAPSISWLTQEHSISRDTARHALRVLEADELVWYVPGHGYYVR